MHLATTKQIKTLLLADQRNLSVEVIDESHLHKGHTSAMMHPEKGHFCVIINQKGPAKSNRIAAHRAIYKQVASIMHRIHALRIEINYS